MEDVKHVLWHNNSFPLARKKVVSTAGTRPNSYIRAIDDNSIRHVNLKWPSCLPKEIWLMILVNYGLTAKDLANLEMTCKWFTNCWESFSLIDEAARLIIKRFKKRRFGEMTNRLNMLPWKERLHLFNRMEYNSNTLASGSYQNIALTDDKRLLTWGAGKFGQLGNNIRDDQYHPQDITQCLPPHARIVQVSAGCGHTGILTDDGQVYVCGDNRYGQLSIAGLYGRTQNQHVLTPTLITDGLEGIHVSQIACGSSHTLFLSDSGRVYSVGHGDSGQLGLGPNVKSKSVATCLPLEYDEFTFVFITVGIAHNVLLTQCGKVFTCGLGSSGQLGHGGTKNLSNAAQVTAVIRNHKIVHAAAGISHTVLISSKGEVFVCGKCHEDTRIITIPRKVQSLDGVSIIKAIAGVSRTVLIGRDGRGYWSGEGIGHRRNVATDVPIQMEDLDEPLIDAAIGNSHIILKMKSGRYMSIGKNGRYQTGIHTNEQEPILYYTYIPNI